MVCGCVVPSAWEVWGLNPGKSRNLDQEFSPMCTPTPPFRPQVQCEGVRIERKGADISVIKKKKQEKSNDTGTEKRLKNSKARKKGKGSIGHHQIVCPGIEDRKIDYMSVNSFHINYHPHQLNAYC